MPMSIEALLNLFIGKAPEIVTACEYPINSLRLCPISKGHVSRSEEIYYTASRIRPFMVSFIYILIFYICLDLEFY
jgi:hypothetical protein